jgi:uncharacterized membrane protein YeiH
MLEDTGQIFDWLGLAAFATTGALTASRNQMDIFGFVLLATVTGIGGGTIRDVVLGQLPVFWVQQPSYLIVCVVVACILFFTAHIPQSRIRWLLWLDAIGLSLFAVGGTKVALDLGIDPIVSITMGVVSGTFGGILRDILGGEKPVVLSQEIYVSAALLAASTFVLLQTLNVTYSWSIAVSFLTGFLVRAGALIWHWSLPRYQPRSRS